MSSLLINIYTSGIDIVNRFNEIVDIEHKNFDDIIVNFVEPGIVYFENDDCLTLIDLIKYNHDKRNITYYGCNFSNDEGLPLYFHNNMFHEGHDLYMKNKMCKGLLAECIDVGSKASTLKKFDFLMGGTTETKDWLFDLIQDHPVAEDIFLTYYRDNPKQGSWSKHVKMPLNHTAETIQDRWKSTVRYSDLIDPAIYNSTFYSAIIETVNHTDFGVFTEKTAKPIVAKRPFVVFGSPGQLKALRRLGFQTFSSVIDESYDDEQDRDKRFRQVLEAMQKISSQDPAWVYNKLAGVLEHNKKHFETTDWNRAFKENTLESKKIDLYRFTQ